MSVISENQIDYLKHLEAKIASRMNQQKINAFDVYRNTELMNEFKSVDLYEMVANKAAKVLWGNGFRITTKNQKISETFAKWDKNNNLLSLFFKTEKQLSARGAVGVLIDPNGNKDLIFNIAQPWNTNQFSIAGTGEVIAASVWTIVRFDNNPLWMISTYTENGINRIYRATSDDTASVGYVNVKMNSRFMFPAEVKMNLDFVPACWFENLPRQNLIGMPYGTAYPDWTPLKNLQVQLDNVFENMWKELNYNRTRIFGNFTQKEMMDLIKQADPTTKWDRNRLFDLEDDLFIFANIGGIEGQKKIEILQGDPKLAQYIQAINDIIDLAFLVCGYSGLKDSNSVKTTSEIQYNLGNETQTTNFKKIIRQQQWKQFFDKALIMEGIPKEELGEYIFEIKDNQLKFDRDQLENQILLEEQGLISKVEMAQNIFGINEMEAKDYLSKIKNHREEFGTTADTIKNNFDEMLQEKPKFKEVDDGSN